MARTAVTPVRHVRDASTLQDAGVALDPANGHVIAAPTTSGDQVAIDIDSTFAGAKTFTLKQGTGPGSANADLVVSLNAQRTSIMPSSRLYAQADGSFLIDVQAGATGTIRARYLAHH
jgi:hypothetical protein